MDFNMDPKILQIIPADGWLAVYVQDDGTPFFTTLACWALVKDEDYGSRVVGMVSSDLGIGMVEDGGNFSHYCHISNKKVVEASYRMEAGL